MDLVPFQEPRQVALYAAVGTPQNRRGQQFVAQFPRFKQVLLFQKMIMAYFSIAVIDKRMHMPAAKMNHSVGFGKLDHKSFVGEGGHIEINETHTKLNTAFLYILMHNTKK